MATLRKVHWIRTIYAKKAECGFDFAHAEDWTMHHFTTYVSRVSCKRCLAAIAKLQERSVPHGR